MTDEYKPLLDPDRKPLIVQNDEHHDHDHDHHSHDDEEISLEGPVSSHQTLGSLRIFWSVIWQTIVELIVLVGVLSLGVAEADSTQQALYLIPSCLTLFTGIIMLVCQRGNRIAIGIYLASLVCAALIGLGAIGYAIHALAVLSKHELCEEREMKEWNELSRDAIYVALVVMAFPFRCATLKHCGKVIQSPEQVRSKYYRHAPHIEHWEKAIDVMNKVITACCMPVCARSKIKKNPQEQNSIHHTVQLVYEIILLTVASIESKNAEILSIVAGLLGSLCGLLNWNRMDIILNTGAVVLSTLLFGMDIANARCLEGDVRIFAYILVFSLIANSIRLKSILHGYCLAEEKLWHWLKEQRQWVATSEPQMLLVNIKHSPLLHPERLAEWYRKQGVKIRQGLAIAFMLLSIGLIVAMPVLMGIQLTAYGSYYKAADVKSYEKSSCLVLYSSSQSEVVDKDRFVYGFRTLYEVYVDGVPVSKAAVTLEGSLRFVANLPSPLPNYNNYTCRLPSIVANYSQVWEASNSVHEFDNELIVITTDAEISAALFTFYAYVLFPSFGILLAVVLMALAIKIMKENGMCVRVKTGRRR